MPWEKGRVRDGDPIYYVSEWRKQLETRSRRTNRSLEDRAEESLVLKEDEVMMKHPVSGALIRMTNDGCIEMMTEGAGIRLTPDGIDLLGERLVISMKETHLLNEGRGIAEGQGPVKAIRETTKKEIERWKGVSKDVD